MPARGGFLRDSARHAQHPTAGYQEGYGIMKIVLRQDVPKLGEAGTIQTVADGYARNYLIPRGFAVVATPGEIKTAEHNLKVRERKVTRQEEQQQAVADKIQGTRLEFTARAGEQGRLFGSITASDIMEQLNKKLGEEIDRRKLQLSDPLRAIGEHELEIHLIGRLRPTITVVVEAEGGQLEETTEGDVVTEDTDPDVIAEAGEETGEVTDAAEA
jgi:large subunit ribosomal protein L9